MIGYLVLLAAMSSAISAAPQYYGYPSHYGRPAGGPPAPLGPDGRVVDTPEVAQLKAAHLNALAEAAARAPKGPADAPYRPSGPDYVPGPYAPQYSGPPAPLGPDGSVVDTPEVQQAKAVHFSLYNAQAQRVPAGPADPTPAAGYNPALYGGWNPGYNHY